eukprot:756487-Hanusia_phi.AAC.9
MQRIPPTPELLAYYQGVTAEKVESFSRLEEDYLTRVQQLEQSVEERHRSRWQYLRAESEVEDLQQALSDAKLAIFDEREKESLPAHLVNGTKFHQVRRTGGGGISFCGLTRYYSIMKMIQTASTHPGSCSCRQSTKSSSSFPSPPPPPHHHHHYLPLALDTSLHAELTSSSIQNCKEEEEEEEEEEFTITSQVFLPSQNSDVLLMELQVLLEWRWPFLTLFPQALRLQTEEQKRCWKEKEQVLLEDRSVGQTYLAVFAFFIFTPCLPPLPHSFGRRIKIAEAAMARERHTAQVEDLQNAMLKVSKQCIVTSFHMFLVERTLEKEVAQVTKDYFIVRHSCGK